LLADHNGAILTPKNYSSILKALYFSAVLGKESSSEILSYLANSKFNDKLVAGIPPDITVAHKIGDFIDKETGEKAYMDCGIVYLPRRPYVLCMVSEGDEIIARQRMSNLSKKIYEYISKVE
ncbi:MAG: serine hydrolase, partial [Candidatus Pacebacteria bacterium]|nr:serine hydrolase [Candidatus Paceibacterota bacterium]